MIRPLAGVRVVDLLGGLLGGYCTKLLADAGAEVTVLERGEGDPLRRWRVGDRPPDGDGPLFCHLRAGQEVVPRGGTDDVLDRVAGADVVVIGRDGPDPDALVATDPDLVVVSITPYGRSGPWTDHPATEFTLQADVGGLAIRGRADRPPYHAGGRTGEWFAAAVAATSAAACLASGGRDPGRVVDVSVAECINLATTNYVALQAELRGPDGHHGTAGYAETPAIEPTADGFVVFTTNTQQQLRDFCLLIGRPELADHYATAAARQRDWDAWTEIVHGWTTARTTAEIVEAASALRIPVAPVGNGATAPEVDHFVARDVYRPDPTGTFTAPRRPWTIHPHASAGETPASHQGRRDGTRRLPLDGVVVLDCTAWWAGPFASWVLGMLGAEVIHVESTTRPDGMRLVGGAFHDRPQWWDRSWFFLSVNTNKSSLTLDLATEAGRDLFLRLVPHADVVVENYTPRVFDQFGFTDEVLHDRNPGVVYARMPAFGLDGPWRDRPGFAQTMESLSGLAWVTGHGDDQPRLQGGPCDPNAGIHAAFAMLAALADRDRTGEGCLLEIPMVESALNVAAEQVIEYSAHGTLLERAGNRGPYAAPQGLYLAADSGWLAIAVADDDQWRALRGAVPALAEVAGARAADRRAAHDEIDVVLADWAAARSAEAAADELCSAGVPAAVARDPRRAPEHPQFVHRGFFEPVAHPVVGEHTVPGLPVRMAGVDHWVRRAAPTLGDANEEILCHRLGLGDDEIRALTADGVIGTTVA